MSIIVILLLLVVLFVVWMETSSAKERENALQYINDCLAKADGLFGTEFVKAKTPQIAYDDSQKTRNAVISVYINHSLGRAVFIERRLSFDQTSGFNRLTGVDLYKCDSSVAVSHYRHLSRKEYLDRMRNIGYQFNGEKLENYYYGTNDESGERFVIGCGDGSLVRLCEEPEFYNPYGFEM